MVEIIRASIENIELLMAWRMEVLREVFELPESYDVTALEEENRRYYNETLSSGEHIACFAKLGGQLVGCGGVCFQREMPSPDNPSGKCAYLMNIYTRSAFRHEGAGEAIVEWLIARAKENNAQKIYLEATEIGEKLYAKLGFATMNGMMKLKSGI